MSSAGYAKMMMKMKEEEKKAIRSGKSFEIDLIEEAGILVTVKAKPNPKLAAAAAAAARACGECSVDGGNKEEMPCGGRSRVVRLTNAVIEEYDLVRDEDYEDIFIDLRDEGQRLGELVNVLIPRPNPDLTTRVPGVGKAFLEFADLDGASRARSAFNAYPWGGKIVVADYFPDNLYALGHLDAPPPHY